MIMSKSSKRKYVTREVLDDFVLPEGKQQVVKVLASRGNNLHEVQTSTLESFLVTMPTKYRKNVWIKRGDYVLVDPIDEGDKVKAEIIQILYKEQIKYIKEEGLWPVGFGAMVADASNVMIPDDMLPPSGEDGDEDDDDVQDSAVMMKNPNWRPALRPDSSCSDDSSDDDAARRLDTAT